MKAAIVHSFDRPLIIVQVSGARSSDLVAVFGVGGLGHLAIQYARIAGAEVVAVDLIDEKLKLAKSLGAAHTVKAMESDPVEEINKLGGADAAICVAVSPKAFEEVDSGKIKARLVFDFP
jgi:propanol-preferring alcohol dehydrogenase